MQQDNRGGLILWIQGQSGPTRVLAFIIFVVGVVVALFSATALLFWLNLRGLPRVEPVALSDSGVTVRELARFDDPLTYPGALAAGQNTIYTGSYATGTVWEIDSEGNPHEIPETRDEVGSVVGLDVAADGTLYILDRIDALQVDGAMIWSWDGETLSEVIRIPSTGEISLALPNDIAVDSQNRLYIVDAQYQQILRLDPDVQTPEIWWQPPPIADTDDAVPTGLAYHPLRESLLITDTGQGRIYEVSLDADDPQTETAVIYQDRAARNQPGFNGITVTPDGQVYVAALSLNQVGQLDIENSAITYLAGAFRGGSDVAYDTANERIAVNNWDQRWLLPVKFVFLSFEIEPHLPFSVDVIEFTTE